MKPDDKPKKTNEDYEDPKLFVVVGDKQFPKPGLETVYVQYLPEDASNVSDEERPDADSTKVVGGSYCSCNKVRRDKLTCGCVGYTCSCVGYTCGCAGHRESPRSSGGGGCRCAPVH